jgi:hypothetical protein
VVYGGSEVTRLEEVDGVQVGNIHASCVRGGALAPVLLAKGEILKRRLVCQASVPDPDQNPVEPEII